MQQLPEFRQVNPTLMTAGQPPAEAWAPLARQGVTAVINLRSDAEMQGRDDATAVVAQGMDYHRIPVGDGADITPENAAALWQLLAQARGSVLVHCASGNRAGALLAVGAARAGQMSPEQALEFGRTAGMRSLEPRVRELLALPAATGASGAS